MASEGEDGRIRRPKIPQLLRYFGLKIPRLQCRIIGSGGLILPFMAVVRGNIQIWIPIATRHFNSFLRPLKAGRRREDTFVVLGKVRQHLAQGLRLRDVKRHRDA